MVSLTTSGAKGNIGCQCHSHANMSFSASECGDCEIGSETSELPSTFTATQPHVARHKRHYPGCGHHKKGRAWYCDAHDVRLDCCKDKKCGGGGTLCVHGSQRSVCKDKKCGGGGSLCEHDRPRSKCKEKKCGGGGAFCVHGKQRSLCGDRKCGGGQQCCPGFVNGGAGGANGRCPTGTMICFATNRYDGRCVRCFCASFPNDVRAKKSRRWLKAKEQEVVAVLQAKLPDCRWTLDRSFAAGVRQRPDARVAVGDRVVLVEIDEDSHRSYGCSEERAREALFRLHAPARSTVLMVRFNPDAYVDHQGVRWRSCFKYNKLSDTVVLDPTQRLQWIARCDALVRSVEYLIDTAQYIPSPEVAGQERAVLTQELFYDDISSMTEAEQTCAREKMKVLGKRRRAIPTPPVPAYATSSDSE